MNIRALFHISKVGEWETILGNVSAYIGSLTGDEKFVPFTWVVANGDAVMVVKDTKTMEKMEELSRKGIRFHFCKKSIKRYEIDKKKIPKFIEKVESSACFIIRAQYISHFAYYKP
jgi:uncharacterized protein